jgi:flavin reductase (DIM6/NTAB) family NADH-FMN oxidoreductase RutF
VLVETEALTQREVASLINAMVAPRPIAWVSTIGPDGEPNLAPFSYFNVFSTAPPTVAIGPGAREGTEKDTLRNARVTGELTISSVTRTTAESANLTSAEVASAVDEWELAQLTPVPSALVAPPRVGESAAALECRVREIVDLGEDATNAIVISTVVAIFVRDDALVDGRPSPEALDLVGRVGERSLYSTTRDRFTVDRPTTADPDELRRAGINITDDVDRRRC